MSDLCNCKNCMTNCTDAPNCRVTASMRRAAEPPLTEQRVREIVRQELVHFTDAIRRRIDAGAKP
jgi:hypothetical protein